MGNLWQAQSLGDGIAGLYVCKRARDHVFTTVLPHLSGSGARRLFMVRTLALLGFCLPVRLVATLEDDGARRGGAWRGARHLARWETDGEIDGEIGIAREGA